MTRRELLALAGASSLFSAAPSAIRVGAQTNAWKVDILDFSSLNSVLDQIRRLGFEGFETSYRNLEPVFGRVKEARAQLAEHGLRFAGCHIALTNYDAKSNVAPHELIERVAEKAAALGAERLILSGSPVSEDGPFDEERLRWKAGALNRAGRASEGLKLRVCYYNHTAEFVNGEMLALAKETDSDSVRFVIDAGYALQAKADVAAFFARNHKRIEGIHLRDFDVDAQQVALGKGQISYEPLAAAIRKARWAGWLIADEERANGASAGDEAIGVAREQIRKVFGV